MKKALLKYVLTFPMAAIGLGCLGASLTYMEVSKAGGTRNLSGNPKEYELTLNNIKLDQTSHVSNKEDVFLRLRFDDSNAVEIGRGQGWKLSPGGVIQVDQKLALEPKFINNDESKFLLEVVFEQSVWGMTKTDVTLLKCNTVAKELSAYNRSYQCFIPGEKTAVVTYRLSEKGVPIPSAQGDTPVASN